MIGFFARHPTAANLLMIAAIFAGAITLPDLERETFPEFDSTRVSVAVAYPGASAADVDEDICQELDSALQSLADLDELECQSVDSRAQAIATMAEGADLTQFYNDILSTVSSLGSLPSAAEEPTVSILARTETVALLAVAGIDTTATLIDYANRLADRLRALPLVSDATVSGITDSELSVTFDQDALREYGVSANTVADAIAARSLQQPLGTVTTDEAEITVRYADARRAVESLEDLIVFQNASGGFVQLRDVARVRVNDATPESQSYVDGARAAILQVAKNKSDDAIRAFAAVDNLIEAENAAYPDPFQITVINNTTEVIGDRITLVVRNTIQGLILVLLTMWMFFSLRESFWIALALPISFFGAFFFMNIVGISINMISLVALLMAVGLIMDDSIVIADNIEKWRGRAPPVEASARGAFEVMPGVVSSFLTTACVFGPLMFLSGQIGSVLKIIPMVLLIALAISLVEAFLVLPHHLAHVPGAGANNAKRRVPRLVEHVKEAWVVPTVERLLAVRYLTVGVVFAILIVCIGLVTSGAVRVIGFPASEGDTIEARFALSDGITLDRTEGIVDQLLGALEVVDARFTPQTEGGEPLVQRVLVRYATNSDVKANGSNTATITVDLLTSDQRNVSADKVLSAWRDTAGPIPDLVQSSFNQTQLGPGGLDIDVDLKGDDLEELESASDALARNLVARADVLDAYSDFTGGRPEVRLKLTEYGYTVGLVPQEVAQQLRTAFSGDEVDEFREGSSTVAVVVKLDDTVHNLSDLWDFPIALSDGKQVTLSTIAEIDLTETYPQITRKDGFAVATVVGTIDRVATTSNVIAGIILNEVAPRIAAAHPGIEISIGGATEEQSETQGSILTALTIGLVGVFVILSYQFRSYTLPLVVMLAIPFALIGVILGHMLLGINLSMPSFVGFASLSGIVVNNAILFMTFFETNLKDGDYLRASVDAVRQRFRPVLLSSTTTFVGLLPIMFETSRQAQTLIPLVVSVAFGLLASTILVVLVFPAALGIYFDFADARKWQSRQGAVGNGDGRRIENIATPGG